MMITAVLRVLVLSRTLFLMMMVAASTFGFGILVVGICWCWGYVATAREFIHGEGSEQSEEGRTIIKEYGNVKEEGQERSNDSTEESIEDLPLHDRRKSSDSTEERTENRPHYEGRRNSAIAEQRIAQMVRDTLKEAIREERSEMEAQIKKFDDLNIAVNSLLLVLNTLREYSLNH